MKAKEKRTGTRGDKEDAKKDGDEKGSKLPNVKFFATNQRGDN